VKVVIVDDHQMLRAGVRDYLASLPGYQLVGEAASARAALAMIDMVRPDIVLMDVALPGMDGIVATREILRRVPTARVVMLSAHGQIRDVVDAMDAGARGYVLKADPPETLLHAMDHAARGATYVAPGLRDGVSEFRAANQTSDALAVLSDREREIFRLAADCSTAAEIARELCIARKTVDAHLHNIHRKLGLHDRAELVRMAFSIGLVHSVRAPTGETQPHRQPPPNRDGRAANERRSTG
jgi:DNA-binding NarL/FixJ family response regulator